MAVQPSSLRFAPAILFVGLFAFSCASGTEAAPDGDGDGFDSVVDCNDSDADIYPDHIELCDGIDNDCDGAIDEEASDRGTYYADKDGDGHGVEDDSVRACERPSGYVPQKGDCNDDDPTIFPGAPEDCSKDEDSNCDGSSGFADVDGDMFPACEDCNDMDVTINPGAEEVCDGVDNDCNDVIDENDIPVEMLCGIVNNGTPVCEGEGGCTIASCNDHFYDTNDTLADGCECEVSPKPFTLGATCVDAIDLGNFTDAAADQATISGNIPEAGREVWYVFSAIDDTDTNGDEYHVDGRFITNLSQGYQMDIYRGGCPGGANSTELGTGELESFDWYTNQNWGPNDCDGGPAPCGEGNCGTAANAAGKCQCNDDTATFYLRISRAGGDAACDPYEIELSNGVY